MSNEKTHGQRIAERVFYHVVDTTQKDRLAETIDAVIAELIAPNPVEIDPIKTDEHFLIIGAHVNEPIGCCTRDGKGDVLAEEPGATFQPVNKKECPICNEDAEPPAPAAMSAEESDAEHHLLITKQEVWELEEDRPNAKVVHISDAQIYGDLRAQEATEKEALALNSFITCVRAYLSHASTQNLNTVWEAIDRHEKRIESFISKHLKG